LSFFHAERYFRHAAFADFAFSTDILREGRGFFTAAADILLYASRALQPSISPAISR
jgi:hypothetical protein